MEGKGLKTEGPGLGYMLSMDSGSDRLRQGQISDRHGRGRSQC